jgi:hypothetical protein
MSEMRFHDAMYFAHGEKSPPSLTPNVKAFKIIGDANLTTYRTFESNRPGCDNYPSQVLILPMKPRFIYWRYLQHQ